MPAKAKGIMGGGELRRPGGLIPPPHPPVPKAKLGSLPYEELIHNSLYDDSSEQTVKASDDKIYEDTSCTSEK
ncbi:MAG: hypothetical protein ACI4EF_07465 [Coprococcus sp.]